MVDYDVILMVHLSSKVSKLNVASIAKSFHYRLLEVVPKVSYPHFIHCFALALSKTELLTNNGFYI